LRENPSSGSRVVPRGRPDMTKLTLAFRNFADAPENLIAWKLNNAFKKNERQIKFQKFRLPF